MSNLFKVLYTQVRYYKGQKPKKLWAKDGVKYGLVTYYPRYPDHQDPPITPTKLLMIQRVKSYKGNPWWHKKALDMLKLNDLNSDIAIVKNTPQMCAFLWKIKHLLKVTPINTPEQLPDETKCSTWLQENGDLLVAPKIDPAREAATQAFITDRKRMDRPYLNDWMRRSWLNGYNH
ncbi:39S ribosomal protein L30, mitochondrial [Venturia canescens]|uniref:39S ribosomal protein L30, mitochondrial n=1 Tax=Venturia canescens TaxID=32260 RepID=UPI001C9D6396|nr:39S ribosomal protein L30, mitochondrial [Venturia canescens]